MAGRLHRGTQGLFFKSPQTGICLSRLPPAMTPLTSRNTCCPRLHHQLRGGQNRAQDHHCASNRYSRLFKSRAHPALSHSTQAPPQGCVLSPLLPALLTHDCTPSHTSKLFIRLHNCVGSHQPIIRNESRCRFLGEWSGS